MAKPRFGLGRGLDALIPGAGPETSDPPTPIPQAAPLEAPIGSIRPNPSQPRGLIREDDDALRELADSIGVHGIIQPLVVTELSEEERASPTSGDEEPRYQLIAGERRWRAARLAGLKRVPVIVREATPQQMLEWALIENIQRSDLNPIEEAQAYKALVDEYGLTQEEVGRRVGKSREAVANTIRLLGLPIAAQEKLTNRSQEFTPGHARAVLRIQNEGLQRQAIQLIAAQGMTVRQAEDLARQYAEIAVQHEPERKTQPQASMDFIRSLEAEFRNALAVKVQLRRNAKGQGSLTLFFNDEEELQRLYEMLVARQDAHLLGGD